MLNVDSISWCVLWFASSIFSRVKVRLEERNDEKLSATVSAEEISLICWYICT